MRPHNPPLLLSSVEGRRGYLCRPAGCSLARTCLHTADSAFSSLCIANEGRVVQQRATSKLLQVLGDQCADLHNLSVVAKFFVFFSFVVCRIRWFSHSPSEQTLTAKQTLKRLTQMMT